MKGFNIEPDDYYNRLLQGKYETPAMITGILIAALIVYMTTNSYFDYFFL